MNEQIPQINFDEVRIALGRSVVWVVVLLVLVVTVLLVTCRIGRVSGEQVGILLNKMTGETTVINQSGVKIYNGITSDFFVLDKTLQTLDMTATQGRGDRAGKDDLKVKTVDGSDVYVDLKVQYRLDPEQADVVLATSGPGDNFKHKWARDYVRTMSRNYLGELTTEEFYNSSKRDAKITAARNVVDKRLAQFGMRIDTIVVPTKPHFYQEYEDMIKKKKLADQGVLEERSKAMAASQRSKTVEVEENNKLNVAIKEFEGKMEQKLIQARASGEKATRAADAEFDRITIGAEAILYESKKQADSILVKKTAEAKGIELLKQALEGEGGRNMVKLEYAKRLKGVTITGKPFTLQAHTGRFEHLLTPSAMPATQAK